MALGSESHDGDVGEEHEKDGDDEVEERGDDEHEEREQCARAMPSVSYAKRKKRADSIAISKKV